VQKALAGYMKLQRFADAIQTFRIRRGVAGAVRTSTHRHGSRSEGVFAGVT